MLQMSLDNLVSLPISIILAIGVFLWPLLGIHGLLQKEKRVLVVELGRRMKATLAELHRRLDRNELDDLEKLKLSVDCLIAEQSVLDRLSTWPWSAQTPTLLATAIVLPLVLYLLQFGIRMLLGI